MIGGIFGPSVRQQIISRTFAPDNRPKPEPKKPGFFGQGGAGRAIAGTIGDVLLQRGGMAPIYGPTMQFRQALAERQRMASLERQNDWQDWLRKQQWERANPKPDPAEPGSFEWYQTASPEQRALYDQYRPVVATTWQGPTIVPRSGIGAAPVFTQEDWDRAGGGAGNGTGNFPGR